MFWDAATGRQIGPTMKHEGSVRGALLTKDERRILSWGSGNFWDAATGQPIDPAVKHEGPDHGAPPTMDEWRNFSWSEDGSLMLWDASWPSGNLLEIACALLPDRDLTDISKRYGVQLIDPICGTLAAPVWSTIERAPAE
jgi:hypothetical protein